MISGAGDESTCGNIPQAGSAIGAASDKYLVVRAEGGTQNAALVSTQRLRRVPGRQFHQDSLPCLQATGYLATIGTPGESVDPAIRLKHSGWRPIVSEVPEACQPVLGAGYEIASIGRPGQRTHGIRMIEPVQGGTLIGVPDKNGSICRARGQQAPIAAERQGQDFGGVPLPDVYEASDAVVPEPEVSIGCGAYQYISTRVKRQSKERSWLAALGQALDGLLQAWLPDADEAIGATACQVISFGVKAHGKRRVSMPGPNMGGS